MNKCIQCTQLTNNPKFCSRSCSVSYNNSKNPKRKRAQAQCLYCQNNFYRQSHDSQIRFCSIRCRQLYRFKHGEATSPQTIKPILIETQGNKCSICGLISQWQSQPLVLIMDHIDGNHTNNLPDNLRLVCPNCDSQLPTFKSRNRGNGRHNRRQRYHNGQSH